MNIYQRINEVRKAIDKIVKDKKVEGYMAVTHDNVTALTREHFVTHGVVIVPKLLSERTVPTGTFTSRETPFIRYEATYQFDVVNADDPKDFFSAVIGAHGIDHGDKAPGKVLSYAKKSLVLKLLELESVSEEEGREGMRPFLGDEETDKRLREQKEREGVEADAEETIRLNCAEALIYIGETVARPRISSDQLERALRCITLAYNSAKEFD